MPPTKRKRVVATTDDAVDAESAHSSMAVEPSGGAAGGDVAVEASLPSSSSAIAAAAAAAAGNNKVAPKKPSTLEVPSSARLVLVTEGTAFKLQKIYSEYDVECLEGDAFQLTSEDEWFAVALEVDGKRVPFHSSEHVVMRIFDERDCDDGISQLFHAASTKPYKDGLHYFRAVEWRQVGQYRITFRLTNSKRVEAMLTAQRADYDAAVAAARASSSSSAVAAAAASSEGAGAGSSSSSSSSSASIASVSPSSAPPRWLQLSYNIVVTDPQYEADMAKLIAAEIEAALEQEQRDAEKAAGYALAPLTKRERSWLEEAGASFLARKDPSPGELAALAQDMARSLKAPGVKDVSLLVPLFESEPARAKRLEVEKAHRELKRRQRLSSMQQLIKTSGAAAAAAKAGSSSSSSSGTESAGAGSSSSSSSSASGGGGGGGRKLDARAVMAAALKEAALAGTSTTTSSASSSFAAAAGHVGSDVDFSNNLDGSGIGGSGAGAMPTADDLFSNELYGLPEPLSSSPSSSSLPSSSARAGLSPEEAAALVAAAGESRRCRYKRGEIIEGPGWGKYAPWHLAGPGQPFAEAYARQLAWMTAVEAERRAQLVVSGGEGDVSSSSAAAAAEPQLPRPLAMGGKRMRRSDVIITPSSLRLHRFEPCPAGVTLVLWEKKRSLVHGIRATWAAHAGGAIALSKLKAWRLLRQVVRAGFDPADGGAVASTADAAGGTAADEEEAAGNSSSSSSPSGRPAKRRRGRPAASSSSSSSSSAAAAAATSSVDVDDDAREGGPLSWQLHPPSYYGVRLASGRKNSSSSPPPSGAAAASSSSNDGDVDIAIPPGSTLADVPALAAAAGLPPSAIPSFTLHQEGLRELRDNLGLSTDVGTEASSSSLSSSSSATAGEEGAGAAATSNSRNSSRDLAAGEAAAAAACRPSSSANAVVTLPPYPFSSPSESWRLFTAGYKADGGGPAAMASINEYGSGGDGSPAGATNDPTAWVHFARLCQCVEPPPVGASASSSSSSSAVAGGEGAGGGKRGGSRATRGLGLAHLAGGYVSDIPLVTSSSSSASSSLSSSSSRGVRGLVALSPSAGFVVAAGDKVLHAYKPGQYTRAALASQRAAHSAAYAAKSRIEATAAAAAGNASASRQAAGNRASSSSGGNGAGKSIVGGVAGVVVRPRYARELASLAQTME